MVEEKAEKNECECNSCECNIFPQCPKCEKGVLVPFSFKEDVFEKWKCIECAYTVKKHEGR